MPYSYFGSTCKFMVQVYLTSVPSIHRCYTATIYGVAFYTSDIVLCRRRYTTSTIICLSKSHFIQAFNVIMSDLTLYNSHILSFFCRAIREMEKRYAPLECLFPWKMGPGWELNGVLHWTTGMSKFYVAPMLWHVWLTCEFRQKINLTFL